MRENGATGDVPGSHKPASCQLLSRLRGSTHAHVVACAIRWLDEEAARLSSAAVLSTRAATTPLPNNEMNSRRFIRSSSQLEDDGPQSITFRWSHRLRVQMLRRKGGASRRTASGMRVPHQ